MSQADVSFNNSPRPRNRPISPRSSLMQNKMFGIKPKEESLVSAPAKRVMKENHFVHNGILVVSD